MSAFIVSPRHIAVLVEALEHYNIASHRGREEKGQALWQENYHSVNWRYREHERCPLYRHRRPPDSIMAQPISVYTLARSYDYQSCEHPQYEHSWACVAIEALCQSIETQLQKTPQQIRSSNAWDQAPWSL